MGMFSRRDRVEKRTNDCGETTTSTTCGNCERQVFAFVTSDTQTTAYAACPCGNEVIWSI